MCKIKYYVREFIDNYRCIARLVTTYVISDKPTFTIGDLFYFKKYRFNYLVLSKGSNGEFYK